MDARVETQRIAGKTQGVVGKTLLAVQYLGDVDVEQLTQGARVGRFHLQAKQKRGWHRQRRVAGGQRGVQVGVNRVGLAYGLGKKAQPARFNQRAANRQWVADVIGVDHASTIMRPPFGKA